MSKIILPHTTKLNEGNAYWMARIANEVYTSVSNSNNAPDESQIKKNLQAVNKGIEGDKGFQNVFPFNVNGTQAILVEHEEYLCMAFRGSDELIDVMNFINVFSANKLFCKCDRGFLQSVDNVWEQMLEKYKELKNLNESNILKESKKLKESNISKESKKLKKLKELNKRPLFLTGHSLGGAMATIVAAKFIGTVMPFTSVYTFGQPSAVKTDTAQSFNQQHRDRYFRFVNNGDVVTKIIPYYMGYGHIGTDIYIDKDMTIDDGSDASLYSLSAGAVFRKVTKSIMRKMAPFHEMDKYLEAIKKWDIK